MQRGGWVVLGTESGVCVFSALGWMMMMRRRRRRRRGGSFGILPSNSFNFLLSSNGDSQNHLTTLLGFSPEIPVSLRAL